MVELKDDSNNFLALCCPFCGKEKLKVDSKANGYIDTKTGERHKFWRSSNDTRYGNYTVRCSCCHARGGVAHTFADAIDTWNTRDGIIKTQKELGGTIE